MTEYPVCPICLNDIKIEQLAIIDPCDHMYCLDCIKTWHQTNDTCPSCRVKFSQVSHNDTMIALNPINPMNPINPINQSNPIYQSNGSQWFSIIDHINLIQSNSTNPTNSTNLVSMYDFAIYPSTTEPSGTVNLSRSRW